MLRRRRSSSSVKTDPSLPFGGKVVLAKKKKPESWTAIAFQGISLAFALFLVYVCYFHPSTLQFGVTWFYAHLGYDHAQHLVGQKYLRGYGVDSDVEKALFWISKAKDQGHPLASYDLAVAHLTGMNAAIDKEEAHRLLRHAAGQGVKMAEETLRHICAHEDCGPSTKDQDPTLTS